jgi:WD40 repeat protein/tRNA A-37 threonylcarbamoyl transferase component Bud32
MTTVIGRRYELLETVGRGGEARVVKALDRRHDRLVALKIRLAAPGVPREALLSEATVLLGIPPHPLLPLVREDFFDGDSYVVAMDWVDGIDLAKLLRDRGRPGLAPSSVLAYLSDAAAALTHLHGLKPPVIHGDVKPGNLILTRGGRVKLVDFGFSSTPWNLVRHAGTPGFQAPELASLDDPSRASDVYALAASAFALLTGSAPAGLLPSWEGLDRARAEQLEAAIRMGLATDPDRRPASPGELVERLRTGWAASLPSGVVTFCVSDIDRAAALWESNTPAMAQALVRYDEVVADVIAGQGGQLVGSAGGGDATVSVFDGATSAVAAALEASRALAEERWPEALAIHPRFALHTGETQRRGDGYVGLTIDLAAHLRTEAEGGQILLSEVTAELVRGHLPAGGSLVDLGPHQLGGLSTATPIYALAAAGVNAPPSARECPFRGLPAFQASDRDRFFGREELIGELIGRVAAGRILAVVGASGSGKSSLLRAGLVAAARAGELPGIDTARVLTPRAVAAVDSVDEHELVVVDQFEELFTLDDDPARRAAFVASMLEAPGPVAIAVRADVYGQLGAYPELARQVAGNQVLLGPMTDDQLRRVIIEPARLAGLRVQPGLVELAVSDVRGELGALPLLSHALRATWERREGRTLTVAGYRAAGGVGGAIAQTADQLLDGLTPDERQLVRGIFLRLTMGGDGVTETRRRVTLDELVPDGASARQVTGLLARLTDARLLTLSDDTVEIAHEALIRAWPTLRGWLDEDRDGIRLRRQLADAARLWETGGHEATDLYRGPRLAGVVELVRRRPGDLNATERSFVEASLAMADRERRAQVRANRRLRGLLAGAGILLVLAVIAGVVALVQRDHARAQALTSDSERVGLEAVSDPSPDRSLLLGVAGVRLQDRVQTRSDLLAALQRYPALIRVLHPSRTEIDALAIDPSAPILAYGSYGGRIGLIDTNGWASVGAVALGEPIAPRAMAFSPDGRTLLAITVGPDDAVLHAIDLPSRRTRVLRTWRTPAPPPPFGSDNLAYSPDGRRIAVTLVTEGPTAEEPTAERLDLLDASTGRALWSRRYPLRPGQAEPYVAFTPAGRLLTSAQQGDTLLWSRRGRIVRRYPVGGLPALSRDGRTVALGVNGASLAAPSAAVTLLHLDSGRHRTLAEKLPSAWIRGLAFTSDGRQIVAGAFDGVHVWDVSTGAITQTYAGQPGTRSVITLDPRGDTVYTGYQDGSIDVYDLSGRRRLGRAFAWNTPQQSCQYAPCATVAPNSRLLATDQGDGTIALVSLRTLRTVRTLPARNGAVANAVEFMPGGRTLITGGTNRTVTFWNVASGRLMRTLRMPQPVWWTAVSPDRRLLAVQTQAANSPNSIVYVVALATGRIVQTHLVAHGIGGVEFTDDGRELAALGCCESGSTLTAWAADSGRRLFARGAGGQATSFDIARDGRLLALGTADGEVLLLDPRTGAQARPPLKAAAANIVQVAFSPDERTLAVTAADGTASLWDLGSRTRAGDPFPPTPGILPSPVFEPNGRLLLVGVSNAVQWPLDVRTWERFACHVAGRQLTRAEWADVLPGRPYKRVCGTSS